MHDFTNNTVDNEDLRQLPNPVNATAQKNSITLNYFPVDIMIFGVKSKLSTAGNSIDLREEASK